MVTSTTRQGNYGLYLKENDTHNSETLFSGNEKEAGYSSTLTCLFLTSVRGEIGNGNRNYKKIEGRNQDSRNHQ